MPARKKRAQQKKVEKSETIKQKSEKEKEEPLPMKEEPLPDEEKEELLPDEEKEEPSPKPVTKKAAAKKAPLKATPKKAATKKTPVKAAPKKTPVKQTQKKSPKTDDGTVAKKQRSPRKKVTIESHLEKYNRLLDILDANIERKQKEGEKGIREYRTIRKNIRELKAESVKIANSKRRTYSGDKRVSGLELKCKITDDLADFMQLPKGSTPTRNEITNAVCVYIHLREDESRPQVLKWAHLNPGGKRNLQNPADRMKIIPDSKLSKLLGYEQYKAGVAAGEFMECVKNKKTQKSEDVVVTDPSLKYYVVQRLITKQIVSTLEKVAK